LITQIIIKIGVIGIIVVGRLKDIINSFKEEIMFTTGNDQYYEGMETRKDLRRDWKEEYYPQINEETVSEIKKEKDRLKREAFESTFEYVKQKKAEEVKHTQAKKEK
jgi:hypothetical protein